MHVGAHEFLPRRELLTLEELDRICSAFVGRGVSKLRITGGEPLVRKNIMWLFQSLSRHLEAGRLEELTLTTNGSQLQRFAADLKAPASSASTSRSTRCSPTASAPSPAGATFPP